ncbi:hypothetical protein [Cryobacterium tagatosivorans]|uniref:Integral membrane protein n=1 Tax=Cryobacterium tagatosivorans TaxID=1259199 RepID=A0A4R8UHA8_9MICO|nr:hypothetical protein [Cryobacterium tagatosivorans]TFB52479.1 hypothetical protein E3O23_06270 [Cryobacterium tagatosivorans]
MNRTENPEEEIARLTAENARLRGQVESGALSAPPRTRSRGRIRAFFAVLLIALGSLLAPVAVVAFWTKAEVTDTSRFVATLASLAEDAAFQAFLVDEIVDAIENQVDIQTVASDLFDGLSALDLPPRAEAALRLLEQPAVEGVRSLIRTAAERIVTSEAFAQVWEEALRVSPTQLVAALQGDESAALVISETGEVGIQLGPVLDAVKKQLVAQGFTLAERIPEVNRTIPLAQSDALVQARTAYQLFDILGFVLPWASILLLAAGVIVARRRARALIWAGLSLALAMALLRAGIVIGRILFLGAMSPAYLPKGAAESLYDAATPFITGSALSIGLVGVTVAVVGYLAGPFRGAAAVRRFTTDTAARVRASAEHSGVTTDRFGEWLHRASRYVLIAVALAAGAVALFVRPLTPAIILWTAVLALLAVLLLELLQRPPDAAVLPGAPVAAAEEPILTPAGRLPPSPDEPGPPEDARG